MKCERCPFEDECAREKKLAIEGYMEEYKKEIEWRLENFCPLAMKSAIKSEIHREASEIVKIVSDYMRLKAPAMELAKAMPKE